MYEQLIILSLIICGNAAPILVRYAVGSRASLPVDFYCLFIDGKRLFGDSKTWLGLVSIPALCAAAGWILGLQAVIGLWVALGVVVGDLSSSFIKRRLGMKQSSMAIGLDQIPESLFPFLLVKEFVAGAYEFTWLQISTGVIMFIVFELLVSRVLYKWHIRKQPY